MIELFLALPSTIWIHWSLTHLSFLEYKVRGRKVGESLSCFLCTASILKEQATSFQFKPRNLHVASNGETLPPSNDSTEDQILIWRGFLQVHWFWAIQIYLSWRSGPQVNSWILLMIMMTVWFGPSHIILYMLLTSILVTYYFESSIFVFYSISTPPLEVHRKIGTTQLSDATKNTNKKQQLSHFNDIIITLIDGSSFQPPLPTSSKPVQMVQTHSKYFLAHQFKQTVWNLSFQMTKLRSACAVS